MAPSGRYGTPRLAPASPGRRASSFSLTVSLPLGYGEHVHVDVDGQGDRYDGLAFFQRDRGGVDRHQVLTGTGYLVPRHGRDDGAASGGLAGAPVREAEDGGLGRSVGVRDRDRAALGSERGGAEEAEYPARSRDADRLPLGADVVEVTGTVVRPGEPYAASGDRRARSQALRG